MRLAGSAPKTPCQTAETIGLLPLRRGRIKRHGDSSTQTRLNERLHGLKPAVPVSESSTCGRSTHTVSPTAITMIRLRPSCSRLLSQRHFRGLWFRVPGHLASIFLAATGGGLDGATETDPVAAHSGPAGLRSPEVIRLQRDYESSDSCRALSDARQVSWLHMSHLRIVPTPIIPRCPEAP